MPDSWYVEQWIVSKICLKNNYKVKNELLLQLVIKANYMVKHLLSGIFAIIVCILVCAEGYSQSAKLKGRVTDDANEGLFGVNIIVSSENVKTGTSTDFDGKYEIVLPDGTYNIKYNYIGYENQFFTITIAGKDVVQDVVLGQDAEIIDEVVVVAGKYEQKLQDITVSMEVLKPQTIENKNTFNIESSLNKVPGVDVNNHQPSIRSCTGWSYGAGSRVMILVDEMPIMSADIADAKWNYIPTENISQVEVLKGASSALFGSQALGGVINVRTAYPTSEPMTKINAFFGVYGNPADERFKWWGTEQNPAYMGASFLHSQQFGNFDFVLGGNFYKNEGYRDTEYERRARLNTNLRYRFKKVDGLSVGVNANYMLNQISDFFMWQSDTMPYVSNTMFGGSSAPTQGYRVNVDPFAQYLNPNNGDRHSLRTRFYRTLNTVANDTMKNSLGDVWYAEYQFQKNLEHWRISAGAVENYQEVVSNMFNDHYSNEIAAYVQGDARYGLLKFSLGVRFEYFKVDTSMTKTEMKFGNDTIYIPIKPVASLGLNYQVAEATFLRASFGQGYRFPAVSEKFISMALGAVKVFPNNNLNPETSWSTEVGVKQGYRFGRWKGFADAAIYFQRMYNMMEFGFVVLNSLTGEPYELGQMGDPEMGFQCSNVGNADIYGLDLSGIISGPLGKWGEMTATIGYTYNEPKYISKDIDPSTSTDDKTLKYRYKHSIKADFSINAKWFDFGFDIVWKSKVKNVDRLFCDERPEDEIIGDYAVLSGLILPGYWDYRIRTAEQNFWNIDLYVGAKLYKETKLSFHVKNLLNQVYCGRPGDICAPRRFEISISSKF